MKIYRIGGGRVDWLGFLFYITLALIFALCGFLITIQAQTNASTALSNVNRMGTTNNDEHSLLSSAVTSNGKIAFSKIDERNSYNSDIYAMDADGSNQVNLTNEPNVDTSPAWSPDGTKIAFARYVYGVGENIYVMNADGSNVTQLTFNSAQYDVAFRDPAWSPDGKKSLLSLPSKAYSLFCL